MNSKIYLTLLFVGIVLSVFSQKKELESITENDLQAHLEFVASDFMFGRDFNTETPGLEITADYLKAQCKKMGLKPGGDNYFQTFEMMSVKPDAENTFIKLTDKNGSEAYKNQDIFTFGGGAKNDTVVGDIVFCGYGWYNDDTKYNDTEGMDIKDKIILIMTRNLETALDTSNKESDTNLEMRKMSKAMMGGARAMILVPDPMNPNSKMFDMIKGYASGGSLSLEGSKSRMNMPIKLIFGTEELANEIVKESGKTLLQLQQEINETGTPKSFEIKDFKATIQLSKTSGKTSGKNVIGIVEGSDPVLKNECVLFTAHYDHLGINDKGEVFNGADDNGTGTVALLEIAEAFTKMKKKPKRSIVFAWVTAEEKGLIGSDYYSQHPMFPLEKTLADINLDMVGRSAEKEPAKDAAMEKRLAGPNGIYIVSGNQSSELNEISNKVCKTLNLNPSDAFSKAFLNRSDYYHFYKNGVPILGITTGLHEDYHKVTDELDKIDYNKMMRVSKYCFLVANEVANKKKRIVVDNPVKK